MPSEQKFFHSQSGPYQQEAAIKVKDDGNGLPIHLGLTTGDPYSTTTNSMSLSQAKLYRDSLDRALKAAKKAGIRDAGL